MEATPYRPIDTGRHACTIGAQSLFKAINDRSPESNEARKFFELSRPTVQCNNVILPQKDSCWICGGRIDSALRYPDRFSSQCDHVLPIAQGVIFLELYTSAKRGNVTDAMKLEYEWAHAICNNTKNATVLMTGEMGNFRPDVTKIRELLMNISSNDVSISLESQTASISKRITRITDYINSLPDYAINLNLEVCPRRLIFKGGKRKTFKRKNNGRILRKASIRRNVSATRSNRKV